MEKIIDSFFSDRKLVLFGTGSFSNDVILGLHSYVAYFVDNNSSKWGKQKFNKTIFEPTELEKEDKNSVLIIISSSFVDEISKQLINMGFVENLHFKSWDRIKSELFINETDNTDVNYIAEITRFWDLGCKFEINSKIEEHRVVHLSDEEEFIALMLQEIQEDDIFYDIGSCVGLIAIHAAVLSNLVVAFEPDPAYNRILNKNIKLNNLERKIIMVDWAVSNELGEISLYTEGINSNKSPSITNVGDRNGIVIKTNSIDNAIQSNELPVPTLMKIDIEGAELLALQGMAQLLHSSAAPRCIFIEIHPAFLVELNSTTVDCFEFLESFGYRKKYINVRNEQLHCIFEKKTLNIK